MPARNPKRQLADLAPLAVLVLCAAAFLALAWFGLRGETDSPLKAGSRAESNTNQSIAAAREAGVPASYARLYLSSARKEKIDWRLLAAIGAAESDHGRSPLPGVSSGINTAGCCAGPMQICVVKDCGNVAADYAVDGDRDRRFSIYSPADAIGTAAAYLSWIRDFVGSDPSLMAAAYNAGPTIVSREGIPPYPETRLYVRKVEDFMDEIGEIR